MLVSGDTSSKVKFVVRYVGRDPRGGKDITKTEADALKAAGLARVIVYQPERAFVPRGTDRGIAGAQIAQQDAVAAGMPPTRPIYFAVDGDTSAMPEAEFAEIEAFFAGVNSVIGKERTGVYGGRGTVDRMKAKGLATWLWQTKSWSNGMWSDVHIRQYDHNIELCNGAVDFNRSQKEDYGQW